MTSHPYQTVLITGCSSGIGACLAKNLHEQGHNVLATARSKEKLSELQNAGISTFSLDVTSQQSIDELVQTLSDQNTEIQAIIKRFANAARLAKETGFDGVQIHGAHGYLVSQFLSGLTNLRTDKWGGSLENRARFVLEIYKNMRKKCGADFPLGIKINSADFQRGAFTEEESMEVIQMLDEAGMDLIEVSGGTYERAAMVGAVQKESTKKREAYFIEFIENFVFVTDNRQPTTKTTDN